MKRSIFSFLLLMLAAGAGAQKAAQSVYFELGGPGLASVNFDTRFTKSQNGIGGRIGAGGFSISVSDANNNSERATVVFVPVGLNYLIGKNTKNFFEVGAGVTPVFASSTASDENFTSTFGHVNFGYRLQPEKAGFTFRAFITPVFGKFGFLPYYGGVSFGYKF
jgi:hypothetical protein